MLNIKKTMPKRKLIFLMSNKVFPTHAKLKTKYLMSGISVCEEINPAYE